MKIEIPAQAAAVLGRLERAGHQAWCVGGCVRDSLLGRSPADWDVATSALPAETAACFAGFTLVEAGRRHGTIGVVTGQGTVEVTTFRVDGGYTGHRRPQQVAFTPRLEDDLARRDFTVNAMAYHPDRGLRDCFGGEADLRRGLLRCVGEPERRFREDALRILRCLRFAATLGFAVEEATARAAQREKALLAALSGERVREELGRLLCGPWARPVLERYAAIAFTALPELRPLQGCGQETPYHLYDCWGHTLHVVEAVPPRPLLRWAALLHDCGKPAVKTLEGGIAHFYGHAKAGKAIASGLLERLRFSNQQADGILDLIGRHGEPLPMGETRIKRLLAALGKESFFDLLALIEGDVAAQAEAYRAPRLAMLAQARLLAREVLARGDCLTLAGLAVKGGDLLAVGYRPGPALGRALGRLLEEVLAGQLANEKPALLARAVVWLTQGPNM
ncbi:CCA tRNA nucleotidyltransferase [Acutalibacter caecimuris]|uniref:CCA tRNA nucleotidyltransferase n=1 Tax=Acutalibacter caecimuris TaxID=3093657 RepID=UPI002AC91AA6|nr:HD domain-containing protein [Acutalibacter sp. M00118]